MKRVFLGLLIFICISPLIIMSQDYATPLRYAMEVARVSEGYSGANWIVSPREERKNDHQVSNAWECDIRAIAAVNDARRLRIDIYLHNPVTYNWTICYAFQISFRGGSSEAYVYFPTRNEFYYVNWDSSGRVLNSRILGEDPSGDSCWVTDSYIGGARKSNTVVSLTLDKDKHFSSEGRGQKKWVSAQFFTGYIQEGTPQSYWMRGLKQADTTMKVRLGYIR